jgi:hypothetical protein
MHLNLFIKNITRLNIAGKNFLLSFPVIIVFTSNDHIGVKNMFFLLQRIFCYVYLCEGFAPFENN